MNLDEYKNYLVSVYRWPIDNNSDLMEKRKIELEKRYSDEYLEKIIADTYDFISDLVMSSDIEYGYYKEGISDDTTRYINLGLHGGWPSDVLFGVSNDRIVSNHLLKHVFGNNLVAEIDAVEYENEYEDGIYGFSYEYYFYMQGLTNLDEVKRKVGNRTIHKTRK